MPLKLHGVDAFRDALDEKLDLTTYLADALRDDPNVELCWEPQLTVVPFRRRGRRRRRHPAGDSSTRINASKRVFCSSTMIHGRYIVRACIVSHRTHKDRIDECIEIVGRAAAELAG